MNELLRVDEVVEICKVKKCTAYKIMKTVNDEMTKAGYMTIRGRVNREFLFKKLGIKGEKYASN
ncbi:MAG: transcriptional regulator [Cetobacterium sp.]